MKDRFEVCALDIHISSFLGKQLNHLQISFHCCQIEWRLHVRVDRVYVRTVLKTRLRRLQIICSRCQMKNRIATHVSIVKQLSIFLPCLSG